MKKKNPLFFIALSVLLVSTTSLAQNSSVQEKDLPPAPEPKTTPFVPAGVNPDQQKQAIDALHALQNKAVSEQEKINEKNIPGLELEKEQIAATKKAFETQSQQINSNLPLTAPVNKPLSSQDMTNMYFEGSKNPTLTPDEKVALKKIDLWKKGMAVPPSIAPNGAVQFIYGAQMPSVLCAIMQVCDVQLETGERISDIDVGDPVRWKINPAVTGTGDTATQHVIIKPLDVGLATTAIITTDRRTYHMTLMSHKDKFMPLVTFAYPENIQTKLQKIQEQAVAEHAANTIPETGEYLGNLDFHYCIKGHTNWKPERVYNDGHKTIIQLPDNTNEGVIPTLLISSPFSKTPGLVNSRFQNHKFIVDQLFEKAQLMIGVGKRQQKVTIKKGVC